MSDKEQGPEEMWADGPKSYLTHLREQMKTHMYSIHSHSWQEFNARHVSLTEAVTALESLSATTKRGEASCTWKYDPDGYWQTACGDQYCFSEGGPTENRVRFCHFCGKTVAEGPVPKVLAEIELG